jgi:TPR repeat protein
MTPPIYQITKRNFSLHCKDNFFGSSLSREQKSKCPHCKVKLPKTKEETFELIRGWAEKGKTWAQAQLGNKYKFGSGVEQSYEKSIEYYTLAIQNGDPNAMFGLAAMYHQGQGVTKSIEKAIELWTRAANQGHASAQSNVGLLYVKGEGVGQSNERAREWWIKAAVQDEETALQCLQRLDKHETNHPHHSLLLHLRQTQNTVAPIAPLQIMSHGAILWS